MVDCFKAEKTERASVGDQDVSVLQKLLGWESFMKAFPEEEGNFWGNFQGPDWLPKFVDR